MFHFDGFKTGTSVKQSRNETEELIAQGGLATKNINRVKEHFIFC